MPALNSPDQRSADQIKYAAIAISRDGAHVGILYRFGSEPVRLLHLAWDHRLCNHDVRLNPWRTYYWVELPIDPDREKQIPQKCLDILDANPHGIPYAFGYPFGAFNERSEFRTDSTVVGLTCASFVVSALERMGISLFDRSEAGWCSHCDDLQFFRWIVAALEGRISGMPKADRPDHAAAVQAQVDRGAVRYQPMEVAGAATSPTLPVSFSDTIRLKAVVRAALPCAGGLPRHLRWS